MHRARSLACRLIYNKAFTEQLDLSLILSLSLEIALGLSYLHPTIVHRDLKPGGRNLGLHTHCDVFAPDRLHQSTDLCTLP